MKKQKLQMKQLKVVGIESVTVPAGTFDAYKVEVTSADNEADKTDHLDRQGHRKSPEDQRRLGGTWRRNADV